MTYKLDNDGIFIDRDEVKRFIYCNWKRAKIGTNCELYNIEDVCEMIRSAQIITSSFNTEENKDDGCERECNIDDTVFDRFIRDFAEEMRKWMEFNINSGVTNANQGMDADFSHGVMFGISMAINKMNRFLLVGKDNADEE